MQSFSVMGMHRIPADNPAFQVYLLKKHGSRLDFIVFRLNSHLGQYHAFLR